ncbi:hypothetical protein F170042I7_21950 [Blautia caecimuris]|uniref:hypothetical protein n=1 Tax=Blautia caecimuris TaxID=1796615 RepID=UPI0034ACECB5
MIKENMRIKENITLADKISAIDFISQKYFFEGKYTPYYADMAEIIAVGSYFVEGYTLETVELPDGSTEEENIYDLYRTDNDFRKMIDQFVNYDFPSTDAAEIMEDVRKHVRDKVDFVKQQIIHSNPNLDIIVEAANVIIESLANFSKLNIEQLTPEMVKTCASVMRKLDSSNIKLTPEFIADVVRDAADFDFDEASKKIIDGKNEQIENLKAENKELRKYKMLWDTRNATTK